MMKNILFISHEGSRTGAPLVLLSLLKAMAASFTPPIKVNVLFLGDGPIIEDFKHYAKVFLYDDSSGMRRLLPYSKRLKYNRFMFRRWAKRQHFDLIYANTIASLAEAIELKTCIHVPIWLHIHEGYRTCLSRGITKDMIEQCDRFISVSSLCTKALTEFGVKQAKISVIPPFSDNLDITSVKECQFDEIPKDTFVVGMSGTGGWQKGSDLFPLIVKRFVSLYPEANVKFVWLGRLRQSEIGYDLHQLGIEKFVITPGLVKNPMEYYKRFDVFMLTSREDSFPLVCMENASLGNPTILFENTSGIVDLIVDGESGLVVPYLDLDAMCQAIYRLYSDKGLRLKLGENARKRLNNCFRKENSIQQILQLLSSSDRIV